MESKGLLSYLTGSLQVKMLLSFQCVVIIGGIVALVLGIRLYNRSIILQAKERVVNDLNVARMVYLDEINRIETVVQMTTERFFLKEGLARSQFELVERELQKVKIEKNFDFITLTDPQGIVQTAVGVRAPTVLPVVAGLG